MLDRPPRRRMIGRCTADRPFLQPRGEPMHQDKQQVCPDCDAPETAAPNRRQFLRTISAAATAAAVGGPTLWAVPGALAAPTPNSVAETAVKAFFTTLTDAQKKTI